MTGLCVGTLGPATVDGLALALVVASALWGLARGLWSQVGALALLVLAFLLTPMLVPLLERPLGQVLGPAPEDLPAAAWAAGWLGLLLVGGVLLRALSGLRPAPTPRRARHRLLGGLAGALKGALCAFVAAYGVALTLPGSAVPDLAARSHVFARLPGARALLAPLLRLPPGLAERAAALDRLLAPGPV